MLSPSHITDLALELGFDLVGFAPAGPAPGAQQFLDWLTAGYAGEMHYMARDPQRRINPQHVMPGARTIIMVGVSYDSLAVPLDALRDPSRGRIARYAWGADYHDILTPRLRALGERLASQSRAYVDTGPLLERGWAEKCGLGFIGRNTCLINRSRGSFLFLGAILLGEEIGDWRLEISPQSPISNPQSPFAGCGRCTRCINACPTNAFPAPGVLDARRCISYLTIEQKGSIPLDLRPLMRNWVFGCDDCQDVCPYVRQFSKSASEAAFYPLDINRAAPKLLDLLQLDRSAFNQRYGATPLARAKWRGLMRNVCVAAGNWGDPSALPILQHLLYDADELIREHAGWAIARVRENT